MKWHFNDSYMGWYSDTLYNWNSDPNHPGYGIHGIRRISMWTQKRMPQPCKLT